jgi:aldose 1-epimerase
MNGIESSPFGQLDGHLVELYKLTNARGHALAVTTYGATLTSLQVPDRAGRLADVVLGFESLEGYVAHDAYFGATVGRVANRIRDAQFTLDGERHQLAANNGRHHLHGGRRGWDRAVWSAVPVATPEGPSVEFSHVSPEGDEGYPGEVRASVRYLWTNDDVFQLDFRAETTRPTLVNLAHHSYWNLGGYDTGDILKHEVTLEADEFTPGDPAVPTGEVRAVAGTVFDFRRPKPVGRDVEEAGTDPRGFDHNWIVRGAPRELRRVARVYDPGSGRVLELEADAPGVQFYSANFLDGSFVGKGQRYQRHAGLCLETQAFPNAINVPAWKDQVILRPGQVYQHRMQHRFSSQS